MRPGRRVRPVPPRRADTRPSESTPRHRADRTTRVSSSKPSSPRSRSTRRSRAPRSITCVDPGKGARPAQSPCFRAAGAWSSSSGRGRGSTRRRPSGAFARIEEHGSSWLHRHRDEWVASGREWDQYLHSFASEHGLHSAQGAASRSRRTAGSSALGGRAVLLRRPSGDDRLGGAGGHRGGGDPGGADRLGRRPAVTRAHARPGLRSSKRCSVPPSSRRMFRRCRKMTAAAPATANTTTGHG